MRSIASLMCDTRRCRCRSGKVTHTVVASPALSPFHAAANRDLGARYRLDNPWSS